MASLTSPPDTVAAKIATTHTMMLGIIYNVLLLSGEYWRMLEATSEIIKMINHSIIDIIDHIPQNLHNRIYS